MPFIRSLSTSLTSTALVAILSATGCGIGGCGATAQPSLENGAQPTGGMQQNADSNKGVPDGGNGGTGTAGTGAVQSSGTGSVGGATGSGAGSSTSGAGGPAGVNH